jgi:inosine-uridine nucleoside N-ribohydrolase
MTEKILLDTDIGSDIDDAVCLAWLLARKDCELLGVTTVSGEPLKRAMLASAVCLQAGREVPIFPGTEAPLLVPQRQPKAPQSEALKKWGHSEKFEPDRAVGFLADTIRRHPGEVTLLSIGPMTNIALLFAGHPDVPGLLKRFVAMAGVFTTDTPGCGRHEWNVMCDPHAAAVVYSRQAAVHRSVGLDVTLRVKMKADEVRQRFSHPLLRPVLDMAGVWFEKAGEITFHDPLAAVAVFEKDVCAFNRGRVEVELSNGQALAMTGWHPDPAGPHEVASRVDPDLFFSKYFSAFS